MKILKWNDFILSHEQYEPLRHNQDICVPQGPHHHQAPGCAPIWTNKHKPMEDDWKYDQREVPPTIQEKQPEHPLSQDKPPIQEIKDTLDGHCNHLLPMVVEVVAPSVEIVCQGCLSELLLNLRSVIGIVSCTFGWTGLRGQTYSLKQFSPQLSTAPICIRIATF